MSSLGDLLLAHRKPTKNDKVSASESSNSDKGNSDKIVNPSNSIETQPVQKVFPERVEKNDDLDTGSNASSTDDYVRELLDPSDRPRNVWHVVEGPKVPLDDGTKGSEDDTIPPPPTPPTPPNRLEPDTPLTPRLVEDNEQYPLPEENPDKYHEIEAEVDKDKDKHKDRDRERDRTRDRDRDRDRGRDRDRDRDRDRGSDRNRQRDRRHRHGSDHGRNRSSDRHRHRSRRGKVSEDDDDLGRHRHRDTQRSRSRSRTSSRRHGRSRSKSHSPITNRNSRTILIMQLNPRVDKQDLDDFFSDIGKVKEVRLIMDSKTRRHKGIAYIEFESAKSASKALELDGQRFFGAPMVIQSALTDKSGEWTSHPQSIDQSASHHSSRFNLPPNSYRIYVGGLHVNITEDMIRSVFEPFGPILKLELMRDRSTNVSRGYAFITYASIKDGQHAVQSLDGFELAGKNLRVSKSNDKNDRQGMDGG